LFFLSKACAAIYLSSKKHDIKLAYTNNKPWYEILIGENKEQCISNICNALLFLEHESKSDLVSDAFLSFLPSLISTDESSSGGFNDPGSFVWLWMDEFESSLN